MGDQGSQAIEKITYPGEGIQLKITHHYKQIASVLFILVLSKTFKNLMVIRILARQLFKRSTDLPFATQYSLGLVHGGWVSEL